MAIIFTLTIATFIYENVSASENPLTPTTCYTDLGEVKKVPSTCDSDYDMRVHRVKCIGGAVKEFYYWNGPNSHSWFSACPTNDGYFERVLQGVDPYLGTDKDTALRRICACN